jgi:hypothetical protein
LTSQLGIAAIRGAILDPLNVIVQPFAALEQSLHLLSPSGVVATVRYEDR